MFYKYGELVEEMPLKDNVDNIGFDHAICDNEASIEWNESEWAPLVKNLKYVKTKCSLYFEKTKYYVSTNGSDEANGNKETPLRTIQEAYNRIVTRGTIILLSNVEESNGLTFNGEGKEVTITSEDGTYEIDRGSLLTSKPIIELANKNNLTLTNVIFNGKEISSTRALIEVDNSSLTINDGTVIENGVNTGDGGGIRTLNDSKLIINGGEIKNNEAQYGGGILFSSKCEFEMNGGSIANNTAITNGGGICINTNGENGSIFNFNKGEIKNNTAETNVGGGLVYDQNSGETTLNLRGTNFIGNTSQTHGGGMYIANENPLHFELSGGLISENTSLYNSGGGIYIAAFGENNVYNITGGATVLGQIV